MSLSDQIKTAIRESGKSLGQISRDTGVSDSVLSRFVNDDPEQHRDIQLEVTADKLAEYFGLDVRKKKGK